MRMGEREKRSVVENEKKWEKENKGREK